MRFKYKYSINESSIPYDYRRGINSLIKEALNKSNQFYLMSLYKMDKRGISKPLTFAVYFNNIIKTEGKNLWVKDSFEIILSTNDIVLGATIYNGMKEIIEFNFFGNIIKPIRTSILPIKKIINETVIFKTLSPLLINDRDNNNKYLTPCVDSNYEENLVHYAKELSKLYLGRELNIFKFEIIKMKKSVYSHYNQGMPGITGIFKITSEPVFLNLINDIGFGDRRSQGFGMLEVIN